ncbi:MAG: diacylglycerol kinase [bacterium]
MQQNHYTKQNKSLLKAFYYATCGFKTIFQDDAAFKQEVFLTIVVLPLALFFGVTVVEKTILISCWFLVLLMEIINSTIEAVVNRISLEIHPLSKKIKDMSAAAVLLSIINVVTVWIVILSSHY